jgi:phosphoketolase
MNESSPATMRRPKPRATFYFDTISESGVTSRMRDKLIEHRHYIRRHGDDMPEMLDWKWPH